MKTKIKVKPTELKTIIAAEPDGDKWNGRPIEKRIIFKEKGTFNAVTKAEKWLDDNGYSYGSMARTMPMGILKGDFCIGKWYNLDKEDIAGLDGVMISDDFREGQVDIIIFKK